MQFAKEYSRCYPLIYKNRDYAGEAKFVYKWANKPSLIIDLGCGAGRHHKYWDCNVVGLDKSEEMLKGAKPKISDRRRHRRLYCVADIENLGKYFKQFPCYTALFNVIGYCNLEKIISQMKQPKGGLFIFDVWDKNKVVRDGFCPKTKKFKWGEVNVKYRNYDFSQKTYFLELSIKLKNGNFFSEIHSLHAYSLREIEILCRKYGYRGVRKDTKNWTTWYKLTKI